MVQVNDVDGGAGGYPTLAPVTGHLGKRLMSPTYSGKPIPALLPLLREGNRIVTPSGLADRPVKMKVTKIGRQPASELGCFGRFPAPLSVVEERRAGRRAQAVVDEADPSPRTRGLLESHTQTSLKHSFLTKSTVSSLGGTSSSLSNSLQRAKPAERPPKPFAGAAKKRTTGLPTSFRRYYERGDLPVYVLHKISEISLQWRIPPGRLDYHHFLPLFFDGVREPFDPYFSMAVKGCEDLITDAPAKAVSVIPQLILPLKLALDTREKKAVCATLKLLQFFLKADPGTGLALIPYLRQLLQLFSMFVTWNKSIGDGIEYSQYRRSNVGDLAMETLHLLEEKAGAASYNTIKYMVPTYESCLV